LTEQIPKVHGAELGLNIGQKETKHIYIHKRLLDVSSCINSTCNQKMPVRECTIRT